MDQFWNRIFLDNSIRQYGIVAAVILAALLFKKFLGRYLSALFFFFMTRIGRTIERKAFIDLIIGPVENFLFVLITYGALKTLNFPALLNVNFLRMNTVDIAEGLAEMVVIFFFFGMVLRLVDYVALVMGKRADLTPSQDDNQLVVFFKDFLKVIIMIVGVLSLLKIVFHQDITKILAGLSIIGAAIALAARESLENLIASFIIFFDKPFTVGDLLKVNNFTGVVERIGLRSTRIRTTDKTYVTVPNKQMVDSVVDNLSLRTHRRSEMKIALDTSTTSAQLTALIAGIKEMLEDKRIKDFNVLLNDISQDAFLVALDYVSDEVDFKAFNLMKEDINIRLIKLMEEMKVDLAGHDTNIRIVKDQLSFPGGNV